MSGVFSDVIKLYSGCCLWDIIQLRNIMMIIEERSAEITLG